MIHKRIQIFIHITPWHAVEQKENAEGIRLLLPPVFTALVTSLKTTNFMVDSYGATYTTVQVYSNHLAYI